MQKGAWNPQNRLGFFCSVFLPARALRSGGRVNIARSYGKFTSHSKKYNSIVDQ